MTQFEHHIVTYILVFLTAIIFRKYIFFPEEYEYWQEKIDNWLNKHI